MIAYAWNWGIVVFEWGGPLYVMSTKADVHAKVEDGVKELDSPELW